MSMQPDHATEKRARRPRERVQPVDRYAGCRLTGLGALENRHAGAMALVTAAGPSLADFDHARLTLGDRVIVAVAGAIRYWHDAHLVPDYWIVSDAPIVEEYYGLVPPETTIIAFQQAVRPMEERNKDVCQLLYTAQTMNEACDYGNPYQFYSRGTVLIAALLAARYMGIKTVYVLGFDCYRTKEMYHFDGRVHPDRTENTLNDRERAAPGRWITTKLKRMIDKSKQAAQAGLFDDIHVTVVNRRSHQQAFKRMIDLEEFYAEWNACV